MGGIPVRVWSSVCPLILGDICGRDRLDIMRMDITLSQWMFVQCTLLAAVVTLFIVTITAVMTVTVTVTLLSVFIYG